MKIPIFLLANGLHLVYDGCMKEILKKKGCKVTPARLSILEIFSKNKMPLDAETIFSKLQVKRKGKNINEATVYRTLSTFTEKGILKKVDLRKDSVHFELIGKHHHHITCTNCNALESFENKEVEKEIGKIKSSKFINIKEHSLELFGLCVNCV